ncbi:hypothetical protein LTR94_031031 [Friedmanniomyces endolithicus]|nr:hypothetical protein LTR94_031031 [Friedmanniomyces endolithicus]
MDLSASARDGRAAKKGPGRGWYALAALPMICGFAAMGAVLFTQLSKLDDGLEQIVVPGARELRLEPGRHTVFLEYRSVVDGRVYAVDQVPGLAVHVEAADGAPVAVSAPMGSSTYTLGGRQGEAINVGPQTVIAVGQGFMGQLFSTVFMGLSAVFLGMILTVATVVGVYLARRRARQA